MSAEMPEVSITEPSVKSFLSRVHTAGKRNHRAAIVIAVVLASHLPFVVCHLFNLWRKPHYQFFPLLLVGIGWILWTRWPSSGPGSSRCKLQVTLLLPGLTVLFAAVLLFSAWLAAVAAILTAGGVLCSVAERDRWRDWIPVWALVWLLVPAPLGRDQDLVFRLQSIASRASSATLDVLGMRHLMEGHVLELPGHRLLVEEACSGINSLFVLLAATALFVVATRRPVIWAGLLLASSVVWAVLANVGRVVTVVLAQSWWGLDLTAGWGHTVLGFSVVALALLMLASTDRLLAFLLRRIDLRAGDDLQSYYNEELAGNPLTKAWDWCVGGGRTESVSPNPYDGPARPSKQEDSGESTGSQASRTAVSQVSRNSKTRSEDIPTPQPYRRKRQRLIVGGFILLAALQLVALVFSGSRPFVVHPASFLRSDLFDGFDLPTVLDGWAQMESATEERDSGNSSGVYSKAWCYRSGFCICRISVDYPFSHWHDLSRCYAAQGWTSVDRTAHPSATESGMEHEPYVEVQMARPGGGNGLLLFSMVDEEGRAAPARPRRLTVYGKCIRSLDENPLRGLVAGRVAPLADSTFQVQALFSSTEPLSAVERQAAHKLFFTARQEILSAYHVRQQRTSE